MAQVDGEFALGLGPGSRRYGKLRLAVFVRIARAELDFTVDRELSLWCLKAYRRPPYYSGWDYRRLRIGLGWVQTFLTWYA